MVRAVKNRDLDVDHREAGNHTVLHLFLDAFIHGRNILARHNAAHDGIDEFVALTRLLRFDAQPNVTVLTAAAGLANKLTFLLDRFANRFAISHLRRATLAKTLNSRFMRSTIISRCSSPMPEIIVWPVSSSV